MAKSNVNVQKAKIWFKDGVWYSKLPTGLIQRFLIIEAATFSIASYYERAVRFSKAQDIIFKLNESLLSIDEQDMIRNINRNNSCTKRQYGWLKGILERQKV